MVFKQVWRLLRSEKWTHARAQGLDDGTQEKYKPNRPSIFITRPRTVPKEQRKGEKPAGKATKSQNPVKKKKMTKKQLREEEEEQRREKSSFSTIWSPPRSDGPLTSSSCRSQISDDQISADLQEHAERGDLDADEGPCADMEGPNETAASNADSSSSDNAEESKRNADEDSPATVTRRLDPDYVDSSDSDVSFGSAGVTLCTGLTTESESTATSAVTVANSADMDPNFVLEDSMSIQIRSGVLSRIGGEDDEGIEMSIDSELQRVKSFLSVEEQERLHLRVQESSPLYDSTRLSQMAYNGWRVLPDNGIRTVEDNDEVDSMYDGYCGPSCDAAACGVSPGSLFYYFLPKDLWRHIASESNRYWRQTLDSRVEEAYAKEQMVTHRQQKTKEQVRTRLLRFKSILPHEIFRWLGLMIAHALSPMKRMEMHWATKACGVIPSGTFGSVMGRDRFREISRFCICLTMRRLMRGAIVRGKSAQFFPHWRLRSRRVTHLGSLSL
ncbi:hypothetical protein F444_12146 [Phytophthora nicotianae P1976]|uniref:PiggyBac transposable element-derived protein domain-containing protein n=1 Tax=Phytophthora nicotianae P1976 TaxID=1317066 RepID=A0A080ZY50_PHYNI|nr:hypothetical protein F444_12146 [Phytophthora nicotianae P1976]